MEISPPEVSEKIRQKALMALTQRYLADAARLGTSPEEIDQIMKDKVTVWQQTGHLPDPETDIE
jgi:hypothetical protein